MSGEPLLVHILMYNAVTFRHLNSSPTPPQTAPRSVMQPEALLPPPFPSAAPPRLYISNMSVSPSARRRGVARRLLAAAIATANRWGEPSVWLHVGAQNAGARGLYERAGFRRVGGSVGTEASNWVPGPWSQVLLKLEVEGSGGWLARWEAALRRADAADGSSGSSSSSSGSGDDEEVGSGGGGEGSSGGVFQWQRLVAEERPEGGSNPPPGV
jgi:hypothetical protein